MGKTMKPHKTFTSSDEAGEHMDKIGHTSDRHLLEPVQCYYKKKLIFQQCPQQKAQHLWTEADS